jgi:MHS family proline/betaine transporter-like MFS transporter
MLTGTIGDRFGRRTALTWSVAAMAIPTFLIGLLPGYQTIGVWAPILLVLLRTIQGFSVGGEGTTAFIFVIENGASERRGLLGAIACGGSVVGALMGSGAGALMANLTTPQQLDAWGWRIPFLVGLLVGGVGYLLRRGLQESTAAGHDRARSPVAETFRDHKLLLLRVAALPAFAALSYNVMFLYIVSWLQLVHGMPQARALEVNTVSMALLLPVMAAAGWLSDRVGRKPILAGAMVTGFATALPLLWLMLQPSPTLIVLGQLGFVLTCGTAIAVMPSLVVETTPAAIRCTVIATAYNVSYGVVGGLSPLAATWLVDRTDADLSPALIVMAAAAISLVALRTFPAANPEISPGMGPGMGRLQAADAALAG